MPASAPSALPVLAVKAEPVLAPRALPVLVVKPEPEPPAPRALSAPEPGRTELQDRIEHLTAALTLTAAAENLEQVGAIAQQALAEDIQYTRTS